MKLAYCVVTLGLLAVGGCFPETFLNKKDNPTEKPAPQVSRQPSKPHTFVRPEQVDERNCHEKEKVLRQELDMDEQDEMKPAKR
jgi:hypothetical protein